MEFSGFNHFGWKPLWVDRPFYHYSLNFIEKGPLSFQVDDAAPITVSGPVAWHMCPGGHYRYGGGGEAQFGHRYISFKGPAAEYLESGGIIVRGAPLTRIANVNRFLAAMDETLTYLASPRHGVARAVHLLAGLYLQLAEQDARLEPSTPLEEEILELTRRIRQAPAKTWDFAAESRKLKISYSYLRKLFKAASGRSPRQFVNLARLEWAASELRENRATIKRIADEAGYDNVYYFSLAFKRAFGTSPGRYRTRCAEK